MVLITRSLVAVLVACSAFAADSSLLGLVSPDATTVAGIHAGRAAASQFGQFLLKSPAAQDGAFQKFTAATGVDPWRDLTEMVVATNAKTPNRPIVLTHGVFDLAKLQAHAKAEGMAITNYNDVAVAASPTEKSPMPWIAFLDNRTILAGDADMVRLAIDRRGAGMGLEPKFAAKVSEVSGKYDIWMVSTVPMAGLAGQLPDSRMTGMANGDMLKGIERASGGVVFGSTIRIAGEAETRSEKDAAALVDVVKFISGMAQLNRGNPDTARFSAALDTLNVKSTASTFSFSLSIPEADLEKMMAPEKAAPVRVVSTHK